VSEKKLENSPSSKKVAQDDAWQTSLKEAARIIGLEFFDGKFKGETLEERIREYNERTFISGGMIPFYETIFDTIAKFYLDPTAEKRDDAERSSDKRHMHSFFMGLSKSLEGLADHLENLDPDLKEKLEEGLEQVSDLESGVVSFSQALLSLKTLQDASASVAWEATEDIFPKRRGRPNQVQLGNLISTLAMIYEAWSDKKFTFQRFKNSQGEYEPITEGHQFVCHIINLVNSFLLENEKIPPESVATECERAVRNPYLQPR